MKKYIKPVVLTVELGTEVICLDTSNGYADPSLGVESKRHNRGSFADFDFEEEDEE